MIIYEDSDLNTSKVIKVFQLGDFSASLQLVKAHMKNPLKKKSSFLVSINNQF